MARIAVIGSMNMDVLNRVEKHPLPGETIHGLGTSYSPGGKGGNQAVAGALAGAEVMMLGAVGNDATGGELLSGLTGYGVGTDAVDLKEGTSGLAFITIDAGGENNIILSAGANALLTPDDLERHWPLVRECKAVLLQNEVPWETTLWAMKRANEDGMRVYFNPAPAFRVPREALSLLHCLILNETEAEAITGMSVSDAGGEEDAVRALLAEGAQSVVLTLGGRGSYYADRQGQSIRTEAFRVSAVDTTAAGDTFIGSFAAVREEAWSAEKSLKFASAAAALSVTKRGAQQSVPKRAETLAFLRERGSFDL
jgi:ribokinase